MVAARPKAAPPSPEPINEDSAVGPKLSVLAEAFVRQELKLSIQRNPDTRVQEAVVALVTLKESGF